MLNFWVKSGGNLVFSGFPAQTWFISQYYLNLLLLLMSAIIEDPNSGNRTPIGLTYHLNRN